MSAPAPADSGFRQVRDLEVLSWPALERPGLDAVVTTRHGGISGGRYASLNLSFSVGDTPGDVLENRRRLAVALDAEPADFVFAQQVHGNVARVVGPDDRGRGTRSAADAIGGTDVLVTSDPGTVLAVLAADCVPIVLHDPKAGVLACAHAGWRGTVARAAAAAVSAMESLGSRPADVTAGLGPAIAADHYEVGAEVAEAARDAFGDRAGEVLRDHGPEHWTFDLWAANRLVLTEAGVPGGQIHDAGVATGPAGGDRFFSHRAARPCGRFAAVARLRPDPEETR